MIGAAVKKRKNNAEKEVVVWYNKKTNHTTYRRQLNGTFKEMVTTVRYDPCRVDGGFPGNGGCGGEYDGGDD
ncbi:hypothetical protein F220043C3_45420 [Enterocloster asparagiformis]